VSLATTFYVTSACCGGDLRRRDHGIRHCRGKQVENLPFPRSQLRERIGGRRRSRKEAQYPLRDAWPKDRLTGSHGPDRLPISSCWAPLTT
jgi:hypothetical protein